MPVCLFVDLVFSSGEVNEEGKPKSLVMGPDRIPRVEAGVVCFLNHILVDLQVETEIREEVKLGADWEGGRDNKGVSGGESEVHFCSAEIRAILINLSIIP